MDFQDGGCGCHLGFLIGTLLTIFYLQVAPILPTRFWVYLPLGKGEIQNRFSR